MSPCESVTEPELCVERVPGHVFLARMGKKLLRPGGRQATEAVFALADLRSGERVCEIATNRAITAIEMARRFGVEVDGVDASPDFLAEAGRNVSEHGLQDRIHLHLGMGNELPFEDGTFDVVIAEAVITMLPPPQKAETLAEAARVLKPGGRLVFHELACVDDAGATFRQELVKTIQHAAWPLTVDGWTELVEQAGLRKADIRTGAMSLMSPRGLVRDEGIGGIVRIGWNVWRTPGAGRRFKSMAAFFRRNRGMLRYIAMRADKRSEPQGRTDAQPPAVSQTQ